MLSHCRYHGRTVHCKVLFLCFSSRYRHQLRHHPRTSADDGVDAAGGGARRLTASADYCADSDDDDDDNDVALERGRRSPSSESLDSIVERILESADADAELQRSAKRKRQRRKVHRVDFA